MRTHFADCGLQVLFGTHVGEVLRHQCIHSRRNLPPENRRKLEPIVPESGFDADRPTNPGAVVLPLLISSSSDPLRFRRYPP